MTDRRQAASFVLAVCVLLVGGCATHAPLLESTSRTVELDQTPFFPQQDYQCGPAALATVLGASGVGVTPETLVPRVYLPGRRGSLQVEMQAAPRSFGRIGYRIDSELAAIASELDAGRPVLVLHNYGLPFWPRWHYAVTIGYDGAHQRITMRSGRQRRQQLSAANFMRAWDNADRWALVLLKPGELPAGADRRRYLEAAAAFEASADPQAAWQAFDAAVRQWPDDPVGWIGRGTASFRRGDMKSAATDYRKALELDGHHAGARNNLAMTLLEMGCTTDADQELSRIDAASLPGHLREEISDTRRQIEARRAATPTASGRCQGG